MSERARRPGGADERCPACFREEGRQGDLYCDGVVNAFDIDPFVQALIDPTGYAAAYRSCHLLNADCNADGPVNTFDIDPFVECIINQGCQ